jgi:hypothetical protein
MESGNATEQHRGGEASILLLHAKHINEIAGRAANRCHMWTGEGGSSIENVRKERAS